MGFSGHLVARGQSPLLEAPEFDEAVRRKRAELEVDVPADPNAPSSGLQRAQGWSALRCPKRAVQGLHQVRDAALSDGGEGVSAENVDQHRRSALTRLLDQRVSHGGIIACTKLGCPRRACGRAQDVANLGRLRKRVQVRSGCRVARSTRSMPGGFAGGSFCRAVRIQRGNALQLCSWSAVRERPCSFDGSARPRVFGMSILEDRKDFLCALDCVAGHDPQFAHGQLEIAWSNWHALHSGRCADAFPPPESRLHGPRRLSALPSTPDSHTPAPVSDRPGCPSTPA